jgi:N-acetylglutamate synthase-like GNAT family acetyltransferase
MYVRDAKNREEVWLLDHIEAMGLDDTAFRSRDYVLAIDEESQEKAGFGRLRVHRTDDGDRAASGRRVEADDVVELTSIGVLEDWRGRGVGAHVVERLLEYAGDDEFERVYALTDEPDYLAQFGFEPIEPAQLPQVLRRRLDEKQDETAPDAVPMVIDVGAFSMPGELRDRFKRATEPDEDAETEPVEGPEDFGIDPDEATYKYDTG